MEATGAARRPRRWRSASSAALLIAGPALALQFVEGDDFPGSSSFSPPPFSISVGTLDAGSNTIEGVLIGQCVPGDCNATGAGDSQDSFRITVPAGRRIDVLTVSTAGVSGPAGFRAAINLRSPQAFLLGDTVVVNNGTTADLVGTPIGPGDYSVSVYGQSANASGEFALKWEVALHLGETASLFGNGFEDDVP